MYSLGEREKSFEDSFLGVLYRSRAQKKYEQKAEEDYRQLEAKLKASEGTPIDVVVGEDAYLVLGFLEKMLSHGMPGAEFLPSRISQQKIGEKTVKRLFHKDEKVDVMGPELQHHTRGYSLGATEVGLVPDGEDAHGSFYNKSNVGAEVFVCKDGVLRASTDEMFTDSSFEPFAFPLKSPIYTDLQIPDDFQPGYHITKITPLEDRSETFFYPVPLEERLGQLAADNL